MRYILLYEKLHINLDTIWITINITKNLYRIKSTYTINKQALCNLNICKRASVVYYVKKLIEAANCGLLQMVYAYINLKPTTSIYF